ncbi:MAG: stage IV sporulation protein A [Clostridia bacterium]|nr:stage IV sporulation protein A [Clostridia bacterium]
MGDSKIYRDIAERTGGDIYIGVIGPVRTGKSTFIKQFMETLVIPNMSSKYKVERATDEMPQSAAGRTIMTTEPKFIPEEAIEIDLDDAASFRVRMIDCVGYIVPSSLGYIENNAPRMVKTPWYDEEIPFNLAAEIGTRKVITEHSTIGLVVTTDGSISDIPREEYEEAEERVINELKEIKKPFAVLLNCADPAKEESRALAERLTDKYGVPVMAVNCLEITESEIQGVLSEVLYEFPVRSVAIDMPGWINSLDRDHWLRADVMGTIRSAAKGIRRIREIGSLVSALSENQYVTSAATRSIDLGTGKTRVKVELQPELFYKIIGEKTGLQIKNEADLMNSIAGLAAVKSKFDRLSDALDEVERTGYGIVMPSMDELTLEEPELMRQGGRYGVRLTASAPSLHIVKTNITTEVAPIVGSEKQSEDLVKYLLRGFEEEPSSIWQSNIFGKSLHELVNEGLHNKLSKMPMDARDKMRETIERIINEGCSGLICIIL